MASLNVTVVDANNLNVQVTPTPNQVINIDRGVAGPAGPPGPNSIGGYPISITGAANYDALMFVSNQWVNVPQTEIADGGNF
jgi:hypothetical protein